MHVHGNEAGEIWGALESERREVESDEDDDLARFVQQHNLRARSLTGHWEKMRSDGRSSPGSAEWSNLGGNEADVDCDDTEHGHDSRLAAA